MNVKSFGKALVRRKQIEPNSPSSVLNRCLTTFDLTALGVGSTLGLGLYVISGDVASKEAGPAVIFSFLFAAVASILAGLCYAEFGARVPKAGSAYIYSYVTVGEFIAFIIGWNMILEYVIGTASVARGFSGYMDSLFNKTMSRHFEQWMPIDIPNMSRYPDLFAFAITMFLSFLLALGVRESTRFTSIFTVINLIIVTFVIVIGAFKVDFHNWALDPVKDQLPATAGKGGFLPFGFSGMMAGAATCFYSFVGFDIIATTGEEAQNPQKSIPISIVASLLISFFAYFGVSSIQTLMAPYYELAVSAPLPFAFERANLSFAWWFITIGALAGLSTSLLGAMFPMPRVLYSMATDGLIFQFLAYVHPTTQTPLAATIASGLFAGIMAVFFDVDELAGMMSIGTLLAYTLVAVSILILRYDVEKEANDDNERAISPELSSDSGPESTIPLTNDNGFLPIIGRFKRRVFNSSGIISPNQETSFMSKFLISVICGNIILLDLLLVLLENHLSQLNLISLIAVAAVLAYLYTMIFALSRQPISTTGSGFKVPWVPFTPIISIFINVYLMMKLSIATWVRFAVWMIIGLAIYLFYGIWNSKERNNSETIQIAPVSYKSKESTLS
ncbi:high affinity cationic amino acid transporter 1-like isoform X2 [Panonychus citri]|uniref:high affinity cationic amino acid transporter 1-like isoform X2 n=1 Tax=Panonychus citri TaxID=50023 RepID=UPI002307E13D|nr:high affinity cationic amino acid transporter 1-like isoform X2 [Panonychus citri]